LGLSDGQFQETVVLHEFGHAMQDLNPGSPYGSNTFIMPDGGDLPGVSTANSLLIENTCINQPGNVPTQDSQVDGTIQ